MANGAVLFIGAGSSCKAGYPAWGGLLAELENLAERVDAEQVREVEGVNSLLRASTYKQVLGADAYHALICTTFGPRTPQHDPAHEALVAIPFKHVLTTNYDGVLQSAHQHVNGSRATSFDVDEWERLSEFRQWNASNSRRYVHVHGSVARPEGIVLCQEEYDRRYRHESRAKDFLKEVLVGQRVVFVGFGLGDEDFNYILRDVAGSLQLSEPRHFAILPTPDNADEARIQTVELRRKYGIEPVYFDNATGDFHALWEAVARIQSELATSVQSSAGGSTGRPHPMTLVHPLRAFDGPNGRSLKRFLRSWRSCDGDFRPGRGRQHAPGF